MPKGKDWLWIVVGALFVMFVLPFISGKLASRKATS
jgi:hypothetical protein